MFEIEHATRQPDPGACRAQRAGDASDTAQQGELGARSREQLGAIGARVRSSAASWRRSRALAVNAASSEINMGTTVSVRFPKASVVAE